MLLPTSCASDFNTCSVFYLFARSSISGSCSKQTFRIWVEYQFFSCFTIVFSKDLNPAGCGGTSSFDLSLPISYTIFLNSPDIVFLNLVKVLSLLIINTYIKKITSLPLIAEVIYLNFLPIICLDSYLAISYLFPISYKSHFLSNLMIWQYILITWFGHDDLHSALCSHFNDLIHRVL